MLLCPGQVGRCSLVSGLLLSFRRRGGPPVYTTSIAIRIIRYHYAVSDTYCLTDRQLIKSDLFPIHGHWGHRGNLHSQLSISWQNTNGFVATCVEPNPPMGLAA